jgi:hypothetical protein
MSYQTYWSILDAPTYSISSNTVFLYVFIFSLFIWAIIKKFVKSNENYEKKILLYTFGFVSSFSIIMYVYQNFFTIDNTKERINAMLESNQVGKVEGVILNFKRVIKRNKYDEITTESFQVDTIVFSYDDILLDRFNSFSQTYNNIIKNGQLVRITYRKYDNSILKIETSN